MNNGGILGINNRTENWKTARYFAPFFANEEARLRLATRLGAPENTLANKVRIELFWTGMRDYLHKLEEDSGRKGKRIRLSRYYLELADIYPRLFGELKQGLEKFNSDGRKLKIQNERNYNVDHDDFVRGLGTNLVNTEIDIVLETPETLLIGEAKAEALLDGTSNRVLVHQLIRQYVMAKILAEHRGCEKEIVQFVVGGNSNQLQVKFMECQGWLKERNVLCWECVRAIAEGRETCCQ